ncbi:MAG: hypothetical protein GMKNLPBB_01571 [Myxococcota bacterium]|nr:hypothetical protein [Myxococcota bacterium]
MVLRHDERVVDVIAGVALDERIVVHEMVQFRAAHQETGDNLAFVQGLARARDHALFVQLHHAVREHLGVDSQVFFSIQKTQHRVGDAANAHLQGGAVFHQVRHMGANRFVNIGTGLPLEGQHGGVHRNRGADLRNVDERISQHAGHARVDFRDDQIGRLDRRLDNIHGDAKGAVTMHVRRADLDHRRRERILARVEQGRYFREEDRGEIGAAFVHRLARVVADEEGIVPEMSREALLDEIHPADGQQADDLHRLEAPSLLAQGVHQNLRLGAAGANKNPPGVGDPGDGFLGGGNDVLV